MLNALKISKKPLTKEEEQEEFQFIYDLLSRMVSSGAPRVLTIDDSSQHSPHDISSTPIINEIIAPIAPTTSTAPTAPTASTASIPMMIENVLPLPIEEPVKRKRGRPKKIICTTPSLPPPIENPCEACGKSVRKNKKIQHNYEHSIVCKKWMNCAEKDAEKEEIKMKTGQPFHHTMHEWVKECISSNENPNQCQHCESIFLNRSNLHNHLHHSMVCNRFAYLIFKKKMKEFYDL
jgi:hypothetical protein